MSASDIKSFVEKAFYSEVIPSFMNYVRIPNTSKGYDEHWQEDKLLHKAANVICSYARSLNLKNANIDILEDPGRTPFIFIDIPATRKDDDRTILLYSHYDKMPPYDGWEPGLGPYSPVIKDGKLYGRGTADDGYAAFAAITAIKCCQELNLPLPRLCFICEGAEETDGTDLDYYFLKLKPVFGNVALFIPMDPGCEDYEHLWYTTSLRGVAMAQLNFRVLSSQVESEFFSGTFTDPYMLLRIILQKIGNLDGTLNIPEFYLPEEKIPENRYNECLKLVEEVGEKYKEQVPLFENTKPLTDDVYETVLNKCWRPCLTSIGLDGITKETYNDKLTDTVSVLLTIRVPPLVDGNEGVDALKKMFETFKPFGLEVEVVKKEIKDGWNLNTFGTKIGNVLKAASTNFYGKPAFARFEGGTIPFLNLFQTEFPNCDIANMGIAGQETCEHAPNEFLNLEAFKKFIMCVAYTISRY